MVRTFKLSLITLLSLFLLLPSARAQTPTSPSSSPRAAEADWRQAFGSLPVQEGGRIMPLDTFARQLGVQLTGRSSWAKGKGPDGYSGKQPVELVADLMFNGKVTWQKQLVAVDRDAFRKTLGLETGEKARRFYSPMELMLNTKMQQLLTDFEKAAQANPDYKPMGDQKTAMDMREALERAAALVMQRTIPVVPQGEGKPFLMAGPGAGDAGTEKVQEAFSALSEAYIRAGGTNTPELVTKVGELRAAIDACGTISAKEQKAINLEAFMNRHKPWMMTATAYGLAIVVFGLSRLTLRKPLLVVAGLLLAWGVVEHALGIALRVVILGRAPVSNTYEGLLWMGLVAIAVGGLFQIFSRRSYYFLGGLIAAELSVLFAMLVPLEQQTNALPAVLRSNYWLIIHVITITSSYGVLAVASVLGHVYLFKEVLFKRRAAASANGNGKAPLITQTYRAIQLGVLLLTAGTILGGVWAADSWGRFWGWDPKETWALISIVVYFAMLHARYIGWLRDVGMAAAAIVGFLAIIWTFYGVNYVMATGLHSYGFGSGGEVYVAAWAILELAFLGACKWRYNVLHSRPAANPAPSGAAPAHQ
jgi:cytochrome c-type biogenesis protein CcsB